MKLFTSVAVTPLKSRISLDDRIMVLGSCFADSIGKRLSAAGFKVCINPFGTLYNAVSLMNSISRLNSGIHFGPKDCVQMGAGAGLVCSFSHHTSFARPDAEGFLRDANAALADASAFWKDCNKVIVSLGTAMVWKKVSDGEVVSNCLKRPASEFIHEMQGCGVISAVLGLMTDANPGKEFIFTVSPIRHLGEGAHLNTLSKATLQLALHSAISGKEDRCSYFPAYEIMLDELRDYRFYAKDLVHPSETAEDIIWERFLDAACAPGDRARIAANELESRRRAHKPMH